MPLLNLTTKQNAHTHTHTHIFAVCPLGMIINQLSAKPDHKQWDSKQRELEESTFILQSKKKKKKKK